MSKGSARRPTQVTQDEFGKRWDATFRKDVMQELADEAQKLGLYDMDARQKWTACRYIDRPGAEEELKRQLTQMQLDQVYLKLTRGKGCGAPGCYGWYHPVGHVCKDWQEQQKQNL